MKKNRSSQKAFSLIELMIVLLIVSAIGIGMTNYLRKSSEGLREADLDSSMAQVDLVVSRMLSEDLAQAVAIFSSCSDNNPQSSVACSTVPVRGAITPLPGLSLSNVEILNSFSLPTQATTPANGLFFESDAIRILVFDSTQPCLLNANRNDNPESGTATIYTNPNCAGLEEGQIHLLVEQDAVYYADLFQIASVTENTGVEFVITTETDGVFGTTGFFSDMGYSNDAVFYPVKFIEYAVDATEGGLYRREITPSAADTLGYQPWVLISDRIETLQFNHFMISAASGDNVFHNRSLSLVGADEGLDSVEDIRGVQPHLISVSATEGSADRTYDNPMTATVESDHFPRKETLFFVDLVNQMN